MTKEQRRFLYSPVFPAIMLLFVLILSLVLYFLFRPDVQGRVFYFPENQGEYLGSERRWVPRRKALSDQIEVYLNEWLLGPVSLGLTDALPEGTESRLVVMRGRTVYLDFNSRILDADQHGNVDFDTAMEILQENLERNFRRLDGVVITIEGRQIGAPFFTEEASHGATGDGF